MSNCIIELKFLIIFTLFLLFLFNNENKSKCYEGFTSMSSEHRSLENFANYIGMREILNKRLCDFYINSSHNSYISGRQIGGNVSSNNIKDVLRGGARCIELDIHAFGKVLSNTAGSITTFFNDLVSLNVNSKNDIPVVIHGNDKITDIEYAYFDDVLLTIKNNAFINTNDPLIIYLEIFDTENENYMRLISESIKNYLGNRLYSATINNTNKDTYYLNVPIKDLLGKIIFIHHNFSKGYNNRIKYLSPVCHGLSTEDPYNTGGITGKSAADAIILKPNNKLIRIYPENVIESTNYDPEIYWINNYNLVSLNFDNNDDYMKKNNNKFKYCSFIPQDIIVSSNGRINKPVGNYNGFPLYNNITSESNIIMPNKCYYNETYWWSKDNKYYLKMQSDGNLVIYNKSNKSLWSSKTNGNSGSILCMQSDGNLVIYNKNNNPIWHSGTNGNTGAYAGLTDGTWSSNCDFNIYNFKGEKIKQLY